MIVQQATQGRDLIVEEFHFLGGQLGIVSVNELLE